MAHEVELKLRIRAQDIARLRRHPALTGHAARPVTRKLTSIYYDTPHLALLDRELSLRVRRMSGGWFQAVKASGHSLAGLHQRMEWEDIIAAGHPDFSKIIDPALTRVFDDAELRAALRPIFTTDVKRTEWLLQLADNTEIEVALDVGELIAGEQREPIREVELELKHGEAARLFELALALQADIPLWIENISKAERGYACYRPQTPAITKAGTSALKPSMAAAEAFRFLAWNCLAHLQGNHEVTLLGQDIEGCHQMRVALRRLRAVLRTFRELLNAEDYQELRTEVAWLAGSLGKARDLDVFIHETLPPLLDTRPDREALDTLHRKALTAQQKTAKQVSEMLQAQRYQRLLLKLGAIIETAAHGHRQQTGLADMAGRKLGKYHRSLQQRIAQGTSTPAGRHALRIAAKKLRYSAEFFAPLYPAKKVRPYLASLTQLQQILGELNDLVVAEQLSKRLLARHTAAEKAAATALLAGWAAEQQKMLLPKAEKAWRKLKKQKPFWHQA